MGCEAVDHDGQPGRNVLISDGEEHPLAGKVSISMHAGDIIRIETPGGGGFFGRFKRLELRISRILYVMIIHLGWMLPSTSSGYLGTRRARLHKSHVYLAPDGVYQAP